MWGKHERKLGTKIGRLGTWALRQIGSGLQQAVGAPLLDDCALGRV